MIYINIPREDSVFSLLNSYLDLSFDVINAGIDNKFVVTDNIMLVNRAAIAFFSEFRLTTSSGKHLKSIHHAHIVSLMYELLTSSGESGYQSIGFDRSRDRRKRELTKNKNIKGKFHQRNFLRDIFGFADHQELALYGLSYRLTMKRNTNNAVIYKANAVNNAKVKIIALGWYLPHYSPSIEGYIKLLKQIKEILPTQLHYPERSVFMKEVNTQNLWNFELGTQEGINVPIWIYVAFQQMDRQTDQNLSNDTFYKMPLTSVQCIVWTEKYPDIGISPNYTDDEYSQGYGQNKEAFKALTKDNILQAYINDDDCRSSNVGDGGNEIGYNIHVFDLRYHKNFGSGQSVEVEFKFDAVVPAGIYGYALDLTNRLKSINSDGQRMFDLT